MRYRHRHDQKLEIAGSATDTEPDSGDERASPRLLDSDSDSDDEPMAGNSGYIPSNPGSQFMPDYSSTHNPFDPRPFENVNHFTSNASAANPKLNADGSQFRPDYSSYGGTIYPNYFHESEPPLPLTHNPFKLNADGSASIP